MNVSDFDFYLPPELIAQKPLPERDASRLLVTERFGYRLEDRQFRDIVDYVQPEDVLVINETRVIPARLFGVRTDTGGAVELLLLRPHTNGRWEVLVKPGRRARVGVRIEFSPKLACTVADVTNVGGRLVDFEFSGSFGRSWMSWAKHPFLLIFMRSWRTRNGIRPCIPSIRGQCGPHPPDCIFSRPFEKD